MAGRGELTHEVQQTALRTLGREISVRELRLMPYVQYLAMNDGEVDPARINAEEREILRQWRGKSWINGGASSPMYVSFKFWQAMCEILWRAYVNYLYPDEVPNLDLMDIPLPNDRRQTAAEIEACLAEMPEKPDPMTDDHQMVTVRLDDLRKALGVAVIPKPHVIDGLDELLGIGDVVSEGVAEWNAMFAEHPAALKRLAEAAAKAGEASAPAGALAEKVQP